MKQSQEMALERARRTLSLIASLKKHQAFEGYLMPRLRQKRAEAELRILDEECDKDELLIRKRVYQAIRDIVKMIDTDEAAAARSMNGKT